MTESFLRIWISFKSVSYFQCLEGSVVHYRWNLLSSSVLCSRKFLIFIGLVMNMFLNCFLTREIIVVLTDSVQNIFPFTCDSRYMGFCFCLFAYLWFCHSVARSSNIVSAVAVEAVEHSHCAWRAVSLTRRPFWLQGLQIKASHDASLGKRKERVIRGNSQESNPTCKQSPVMEITKQAKGDTTVLTVPDYVVVMVSFFFRNSWWLRPNSLEILLWCELHWSKDSYLGIIRSGLADLLFASPVVPP